MAKFSRQDYEATAAVLREVKVKTFLTTEEKATAEFVIGLTIDKFATLYERDNPRFSREKFFEAIV